MKKKFINGILMVAMLFAATTSFVSCKDNVDDFAVDIYATIEQVRADLQNQLNGLESRISSLEGRMSSAEGEIKNLWTETQRLQGEIDALDVKLNNLQSRVDAIEGRLDEIEKRVAALEESLNELITDITVQETNSPVLGTIDLPVLHTNFLAAYYAEIVTDFDAFPYESEWDSDESDWIHNGVTVDQANGNRLRKSEIANWVPRITFKKNTLVTNFEGNAGKLYFSLNPVGVNTDNVSFSLINSQGVESPVELSNIQKSAHQLTWAFGKHGNGTDVNEGEASDYLYEAIATVPVTRIMENDFPYQNVFKQATVGSDINNIIKGLQGSGDKKSILKSAYELMQNFYQGELEARKNMVYWYLKADKTLTDGSTKEYVAYNQKVSIASVRPLSYNFFWNLDDDLTTYIDMDEVAGAAAGIMSHVLNQVPDFDFSQYKITDIKINNTTGNVSIEFTNAVDGTTWTDDYNRLDPDGISHSTWYYNEYTTQAVSVEKFFKSLEDAMNENLVTKVNEMIDEMSKQFSTIASPSADDLQAKVTNFLTKASNKLVSELGTHYAYRAVAPIVLFDGPNGVQRLLPGATLKQEFPTSTFFFTSPTEEYLVPAMLKYIAVLKGGKIMEAYVQAGWNKVQDLNLPEGDIEIVYQTVDFNGYVITKRYPITVVK